MEVYMFKGTLEYFEGYKIWTLKDYDYYCHRTESEVCEIESHL